MDFEALRKTHSGTGRFCGLSAGTQKPMLAQGGSSRVNGHTLLKSHDTVNCCWPKRLSLAIAKQSLPAMAMQHPPLYCMMLCADGQHVRSQRASAGFSRADYPDR